MTISWQYHQCQYEKVIEHLQKQQQQQQQQQHQHKNQEETQHHLTNEAYCWQRTLAREADIALCQFRKSKCYNWHLKALKSNHDYADALQQTQPIVTSSCSTPKTSRSHCRHWIRSVLLTGINGAWLQLYSFPEKNSKDDAKNNLILAQKEMQRAIATCYNNSLYNKDHDVTTATTIDNTNSIYFWNNTSTVVWQGWERIKRQWFSSSDSKRNRNTNKKQTYVKDQVEHTLRVLYNNDNDGTSGSDSNTKNILPLESTNAQTITHDSVTETNNEESSIQQEQEQEQLIPHHFISQALIYFSSSLSEQYDDQQKHHRKKMTRRQTRCCRFLKHAATIHGKGSWSYVIYVLFQALLTIHKDVSSQQQQTIFVKDLIQNLQPHQTSNLFIGQILAALHLLNGDYPKALEQWQTLLQLSSKSSSSIQHYYRNLDQIIITNMAQVFALLGNANASLELYLHVLSDCNNISNHPPDDAQDNNKQTAKPMYLHLSFCKQVVLNDEMISYSYNHENIQYEPHRKELLLWRLYQVAMTGQDWVTCITSSEHLLLFSYKHRTEGNHQKIIALSSLAKIFALLQGRRTSLAWKELNDLDNNMKNKKSNVLLNDNNVKIEENATIDLDSAINQILLNLYKADASILMKQIIETVGDYDDVGDDDKQKQQQTKEKIELVHNLINETLEHCDRLLLVINDENEKTKNYYQNLVVAVWNNFALTWLLKGNVIKSMYYFQKTIRLLKQIKQPPQYSSSLQTAFNLSLTLWKHGHKRQASQTWLLSRNIPILDENDDSSSSDNNESKKKKIWIDGLKDLLQKAITNHECLQASINRGDCEFELEHIIGWHPPSLKSDYNHVYRTKDQNSQDGIPSDQVWAMDIMMLRQTVSHHTRKEGMKYFRKNVYKQKE